MEVIGGDFNVNKIWWYLIEYFQIMWKWVANDALTELDLVATSYQEDRVLLKRLQAHEV